MNIPYIYLSVNPKNNAPFIASNDFQMVYKGTQYLINKGHQKLLLLVLILTRKTLDQNELKDINKPYKTTILKDIKMDH